jgi:Mg-chelatase subunit ChlI
LLDRFALSVDIVGIRDARERVMIMERNLGFEAAPERFRSEWLPQELELSRQIERARQLLEEVTYTRRDMLSIAALTASLNVDGHRADLVILKTARAQAAFEGRTAITERDIALAAELTLPHRIKRGPFQQSEIGFEELQERISQLQSQVSGGSQSQPNAEQAVEEMASQKKKI